MVNVNKINRMLKEKKINDAITDAWIDELKSVEKIKRKLGKEINNSNSMLEEYTNKSGATNITVSGVVKEYKAYTNQLNNLLKNLTTYIDKKIKDLPENESTDDELIQLFKRKKA